MEFGIHDRGVNLDPDRVVMLIRTYEELDRDCNMLDGFQNRNCTYYHLPLLCANPMDYYTSRHILGHVRLKPVETIKRQAVSRTYKESHPSDRKDLIDKHEDE